MVKAEKGTPKYISKKMKAKGLQKLKHYCQMCNKQCRDENGFKCHLTSDSHLRLMQVFRSNSKFMLDSFSKKFEQVFLDELKRRHGTKKTCANIVYQDVIRERHHIHMNATLWTTLTDFVKYLGKSGKCKVEESERGWYISYVERDPAILKIKENYECKRRNERIAEERIKKNIKEKREEAVRLIKQNKVACKIVVAGNMDKGEGIPIVKFTLKNERRKNIKGQGLKLFTNTLFLGKNITDHGNTKEMSLKEIDTSFKKIINESKKICVKKSPSNKILKIKMSSQVNSVDHVATRVCQQDCISKQNNDWITPHILVRIISNKISNGMYYRRKGIVQKIFRDKHNGNSILATIEVIDSKPGKNDGGEIINVYQNDLETVIPKINKKIIMLDGNHCGKIGKLINIEKHDHSSVELMDGIILRDIPFRYFSKWVG